MPKYVALIYGDETQYANADPEDGAKMMKAYEDYTEAVRNSGVFEAGEGLQGTNTATTVRVHNGELSTTDGPLPRQRSSSAASTPQLQGTSTRQSSGLPRSPERMGDRSRSVPSWSSRKEFQEASNRRRVSSTACSGRARTGGRDAHPLTGDFDLAEEGRPGGIRRGAGAMAPDGLPPNPGAWLTMTPATAPSTGSRKRRLAEKREAIAQLAALEAEGNDGQLEHSFPDDRLRLIFTCCHPALAPEARVALTLWTLGGLTTEEIARRSSSARRPWRSASSVPSARSSSPASPTGPSRSPAPRAAPLGARGPVPRVQRGVCRTTGDALSGGPLRRSHPPHPGPRRAHAGRARGPQPARPHACCTTHAAPPAFSEAGELVLLDDQDRDRWTTPRSRRGWPSSAGRPHRPPGHLSPPGGDRRRARAGPEGRGHRLATHRGPLQELARSIPSLVVELNRAVAVAMAEGPAAGLELIAPLEAGSTSTPHSTPPAADLLRRLGRFDDARQPTNGLSVSPPTLSSAASFAAGLRGPCPLPRRPVRAGSGGWRADPTAAIIYQAHHWARRKGEGGRMDLSKLSRGDRIVVIAGALLVIDLLFLPWHSISVPFLGSVNQSGISGPNAFLGFLAALIAAAMVAQILVSKFTTASSPTFRCLATCPHARRSRGHGLLLLKLILQTKLLSFGAYLAIVLAAGLAFGATR